MQRSVTARQPTRVGRNRSLWQASWLLVLALLTYRSTAAAEVRADWIISQINQKNASLPPTLRTEKYGMMAESTFAFFRATNHRQPVDTATHIHRLNH